MSILIYKKLVGYRYRVEDNTDLHFMNPKLVEWLREHKQCQFHPYFNITSTFLTANSGYSWDGATLAFNTENLIIPSLIHDIGCQAINLGYLPRETRKHFDKEYYLQSLKYGVCKPRAMFHYVCIYLWGKIPKKEKVAPYAKKHVISIK